MPAIILKSISILSDAGLGMAMFSLGPWIWKPSPPLWTWTPPMEQYILLVPRM